MSTPHPELNATVGRLVQGRKLFTVKPDTTLWEAIKLMAKENVHRFPVVDDAGKLVGIITDRDLRLATNSPFLGATFNEVVAEWKEHQVKQIMKQASIMTVDETDTLVDAAKLMRVQKVGGLPVLNQKGELTGIVTRSDILDHLIRIIEPYNSTEQNPTSQ